MVDTIKLFTPDHSKVSLGYIERVYGSLTELTVGDYYSFSKQIQNFTFKYDSYGLHLEGSAPKFINGNNIETLKFHQLPIFIHQLSNSVGFDVSDLKISRIDMTDNLKMDRIPRIYKRYLGSCRYFQRTDYSYNGLNYINNTRHLLFYDKLLEINNKGGIVPANLLTANLLRYEYSVLKRRKDHLGENIETLQDLLIPANYLMVIEKWEKMFNEIKKISHQSSIVMPYRPGMKPKELFCLRGTQTCGGLTNSLSEIDEWEALGHITRRKRDTLKNTLIQSQNVYNGLLNEPEDLKQELIDKFNLKVQENRRMI